MNRIHTRRPIANSITLLLHHHQHTFSSKFHHFESNNRSNAFSQPQASILVPAHNLKTSPPSSIHVKKFQYEQSDVISSNKMITDYIRSGNMNSALIIFNSMPVRSTITWNSILAGYSKKIGKVSEARQLFDKIPEPDTISFNTMLACYLQNSDIESACAFFHSIPVKDIVSWNTLISGLSQNGMMNEARKLFDSMPVKNNVSWNAMISGYSEMGDLDSSMEFLIAAPVKTVIALTAVMTGYMKIGNLELAEKTFKEMPIKNLVTLNAMISGYVENCQSEKGMKVFKSILESGLKPNASSLSSTLLGCSNLSALQLGKQVHQFTIKSLLNRNTTVATSLISMYCKCGDLEMASKIFIGFHSKDVVTWNAMISGYAHHGFGQKALELFDEMRILRVRPDWITLIGVLSACNHSGLIERGINYFDNMGRDYGIEVRPDHYTCMVDLLGRAGKLDEAVDLIKRMPFKPHNAIFGTLLGACRVHKNARLAEFAARGLIELEPRSGAGYVQLANVYASTKRWDRVVGVRQMMKDNGVVKTAGFSWVEVKNVVHEFRSGDFVHSEMGLIREKLKELGDGIRLAGYIANLEWDLHDVGDEEKGELLMMHSERLAIAFGLMKLGDGIPIRVFKNLRVCGDCHEATKFISIIEKREIIVRDTSRFHHFKNGICSCGDYW
ncbi:pentatricopeptide repeat-containing protein At4g16835, mitochondrial [Impatiens glandulifera]|uniref:pentatricopeptide repeat-containing protein At4g16835, mitochondrial n=1 Tax=Impatiens glandulifera TaxID=253017 RepID=UPI001FB12A6A|nr:pentatricopeptide repeat-containing protein At4g16835, mitochondrial [Impatiens glandulifera]